jgi:hypothetical protein
MTGQLSPLAQGKAAGTTGYTSKLLKTGQTTQYDSELDDGYYEVGVAKSYTINTTGSQSGTSNVDFTIYAGGAGAITFNNSTKKITDSGNGLKKFKTNDVILTSSASNPGPFTVTTGNVAGEIVCTGATFTDETPAGAVTIARRVAISNNTVIDNGTGLEWLRTYSSHLGIESHVVFSGALNSIFALCTAINAASVGGYNDWRVPNVFELYSLVDFETPNNHPDTTAFPTSHGSGKIITSTTFPGSTTYCYSINFSNGKIDSLAKNAGGSWQLVRGGTA